jgi:hypothetical protein
MDWTGVEQGPTLMKDLQVPWEILENMDNSKAREIWGSHDSD